jgi:hypothetical protein
MRCVSHNFKSLGKFLLQSLESRYHAAYELLQRRDSQAVKLREWLPKIAIISLKAMPYDQRRLKLRHLRAIIAGLV